MAWIRQYDEAQGQWKWVCTRTRLPKHLRIQQRLSESGASSTNDYSWPSSTTSGQSTRQWGSSSSNQWTQDQWSSSQDWSSHSWNDHTPGPLSWTVDGGAQPDDRNSEQLQTQSKSMSPSGTTRSTYEQMRIGYFEAVRRQMGKAPLAVKSIPVRGQGVWEETSHNGNEMSPDRATVQQQAVVKTPPKSKPRPKPLPVHTSSPLSPDAIRRLVDRTLEEAYNSPMPPLPIERSDATTTSTIQMISSKAATTAVPIGAGPGRNTMGKSAGLRPAVMMVDGHFSARVHHLDEPPRSPPPRDDRQREHAIQIEANIGANGNRPMVEGNIYTNQQLDVPMQQLDIPTHGMFSSVYPRESDGDATPRPKPSAGSGVPTAQSHGTQRGIAHVGVMATPTGLSTKRRRLLQQMLSLEQRFTELSEELNEVAGADCE